ncbi:MAG: L-lactate dehydrogenase [Bacteroidota bacterium]
MIQRRSVGIVGTGHVGMAAAYALFLQRLASDLVLVDLNRDRAEGEAMDLMHAQALVGRVTVRAGSYEDLADAQVIVVTAGVSQKDPSESRLALLRRNADVFASIVADLDRHAPNAILVIATNPVDVLTAVTIAQSSRDPRRVFGTGTTLDSARFRALLGKHYGVDPRSVHGYILGEHGDSEVPIWSSVTIGTEPIYKRTVLGRPWDQPAMDALFDDARRAAYHIIAKKGYTNTAIGVVIARLVRAVLADERSVHPISVPMDGAYGLADVCLSIPCVVGIGGVEAPLPPSLSDTEFDGIQRSGAVLQDNLAKLEG